MAKMITRTGVRTGKVLCQTVPKEVERFSSYEQMAMYRTKIETSIYSLYFTIFVIGLTAYWCNYISNINMVFIWFLSPFIPFIVFSLQHLNIIPDCSTDPFHIPDPDVYWENFSKSIEVDRQDIIDY